ncbi:ShlB/FhaC/HecB family hemolysin secretion/activation protein [Celeribacter litoreus]|uniref:ShlB/FhaC/HecB family hemolysin secretion/activation protein n=1 Tax=Celeribacter litoreus TaxID=2876714 RepID=UPI001CCF9ACB|nr:ShlB/FhaC/HecB family hemolysin secretion/activation protein [Celeribacter litoreus]
MAIQPAGAEAQDFEQYNLVGVTQYDAMELLSFASQAALHQSGEITAQSLAQTVQAIYLEDGYFLAEVFIAADGTTVIVDEGEIGSISIEGTDAQTSELIGSYMAPVIGRRGITQKDFERSIMLVEDIEAISATAAIDYAPNDPHARLTLRTEELDKSFGSVTLDHPSRGLDEAATLTFGQTYLNALTPGDMVRLEASTTLEYGSSNDSTWGALTYRTPFGGSGAFVEGYLGTVTAFRNADGLLQETDVEGRTAIFATGFPFVRDVDTYGYGLAEFRHAASDVDVAGNPIDSEVNVLALSWIYGAAFDNGGAFEYALSYAAGERSGNAGGLDDGDDSFSYIRFGGGIEHPLTGLSQDTFLRVELWGQYTNDRLPGLEEFHLGGRSDERGYLFAEATGDTGISASFEIDYDIFPDHQAIRHLRPFGFLDVGYIENNAPGVDEIDHMTLASLGLGLDADFNQGVRFKGYIATPLKDGTSTEAGDPALYLSLSKQW